MSGLPAAPLIDLDSVERTYGADAPIRALHNVSLAVLPGEWLAVVGPSGSGKSTLLNILGLLDRPTNGHYRLAGEDVSSLPDRDRAALRGGEFGFVFQGFHLLAHRPVIDNVMLADVYRRGLRRDRRNRARDALERVHLSHRADYMPSRLSGGERQRAAIARAVFAKPSLLLCDEPTGNLDVATGTAILDLFAEMHRTGLTIVMITHDLKVASQAERRVEIVDGQLSEVT